MLVSLYTVRIVLNVLGAEDYGICNVVGGVVTMFSFLSNAMATASQRYFAFDLGKQDYEHLKTTFSVTFQIYVLLAVIIVVLAETIGLWFVMNKLVIPPERMTAAICIYQAAVVSFLLSLITTPYMASLIAHENMNIYAYVSIVEAVLKLAIVFLLQILSFDKLVLYGLLLTMVSLINTTIYRVYCTKHYSECKFQFVKDKALFKELVSYSGWNLFGSVASIARMQGVGILLNLFFGPIVNSARAIADHIYSITLSFTSNFATALRPQIIKNYAMQKKNEMLNMTLYGTKIVFFLMLVISVPLFFKIPDLLTLWLENVPDHTYTFVRMVLIAVIIDSISHPLMAVVQATGKIRLYQIIVGGILFLNLPLAYIFLKLGCYPAIVYIIQLLISVSALFARIIMTQRIISFNLIIPYAKLLALFLVLTIGVCIVPFVLSDVLNDSIVQLAIFICLAVLWSGCLAFFVGLNKNERTAVIGRIKKQLSNK